MKNNLELAKEFIEEHFHLEPGLNELKIQELTELLDNSQKELISVLTQIHEGLSDRAENKTDKITAYEISWKLAIEKLGIIDDLKYIKYKPSFQ